MTVEGLIQQSRRLVSGRWVAYAEWGVPDGLPVVAWPGGFGSRYGWGWARAWASASGVRLVIPDRPGYGRSDPCSDRTIASTAADVHELLRRLGVRRYSVLGNSSGGPYALATAALHPEAVERVGVVSGVAPFGRSGWQAGMSVRNRRFWTAARRGPTAAVPLIADAVEQAGRDVNLHPERRADIAEAVRQGPHALAYDAWLVARSWGIDLGAIDVRIDVWHGALDDDVPLGLAQGLVRMLPRSALHLWPRQGHEIGAHDMADVYAVLLAPGDAASL